MSLKLIHFMTGVRISFLFRLGLGWLLEFERERRERHYCVFKIYSWLNAWGVVSVILGGLGMDYSTVSVIDPQELPLQSIHSTAEFYPLPESLFYIWFSSRIHNALKGIPDDRDGLFDTIQRSKNHYQKRAYQCIKCMVALFSNCPVAYQILQVREVFFTAVVEIFESELRTVLKEDNQQNRIWSGHFKFFLMLYIFTYLVLFFFEG